MLWCSLLINLLFIVCVMLEQAKVVTVIHSVPPSSETCNALTVVGHLLAATTAMRKMAEEVASTGPGSYVWSCC